jgi:hypothetical protein
MASYDAIMQLTKDAEKRMDRNSKRNKRVILFKRKTKRGKKGE